MKRKQRMFMSLLLAFVLVCAPTAQVLAESYDVADDLSEEVLYPGDELTGLTDDVTLKVDDEEISFEDGTWKNDSDDVAYSVSQKDDGSIELKEKYLLTVENGKAEGDGFYEEDEKVSIQAQDPEDGSVFAGWAVDMDDDEDVYVEFEDASSASTTLTMPSKPVTVKANFEVAPEPETEAPAETEPAPETEAPAEAEPEPAVETEAPVVDVEPEPAAETEAPVVEVEPEPVVETEAPVEVEPEPVVETEPETEEPVQIMAFHVVTIDYEFDDAYAVPETENYDAGETVEITAEDLTASGYEFNSWYVESLNVEPESLTDPTITFVMPDEDVSIAAVYDNLTESDGTDTTVLEPGTVYFGDDENPDAENPDDGDDTTVLEPGPEDEGGNTGDEGGNTGDEGDSTGDTDYVYVQVNNITDIKITVGDETAEYDDENGYKCEVGSTVNITVESSLDKFDHWEVYYGDGLEFDEGNITWADGYDSGSDPTTFSIVMPNENVTITAVGKYTISIVDGEITDPSGEEEYTYVAGEEVNITIKASEKDGQDFANWIVDPNNLDITGSLDIAETALKFDMPESNVTFTAKFTASTDTKNDNTGDGDNDDNSDDGSNGGNTNGGSTNNNGTDDGDNDTDPVVQTLSYTVTVVNGYASKGSYEPGEIVTITSDYPETNKEFSTWTLVSGQTELEDASRATTTFTMPEGDVVVSASYQNGPTSYIEGIEEDGIYASEEKLTFTPVGGGMNNTNPNPGDIRYVPTSYTIGNVSNTWSSAPYTTSMSIKKAGEYTLTVCFTKQVWNGGSWADDGTTYLATVTFHIVDPAGSVETGDTTPINMVLTIAVVALVIFLVILTVFLVRRRRRSKE